MHYQTKTPLWYLQITSCEVSGPQISKTNLKLLLAHRWTYRRAWPDQAVLLLVFQKCFPIKKHLIKPLTCVLNASSDICLSFSSKHERNSSIFLSTSSELKARTIYIQTSIPCGCCIQEFSSTKRKLNSTKSISLFLRNWSTALEFCFCMLSEC